MSAHESVTVIRNDDEREVSVVGRGTGVHLMVETPSEDEDHPGVFCVLNEVEVRALHSFLTEHLRLYPE